MAGIKELVGAPKDVEIEGKSVRIYPLKVKDMEIFNKQNPTPEEQKEMSKELIIRSIKDEDVTKDDIENMTMEAFLKLAEEVNKLNGFAEDDRVGKVKEKIAQQRKQ